MADDFAIQVRQIAQYPQAADVGPKDVMLIQQGGLGGPYRSMLPASLVATAMLTVEDWMLLPSGFGLAWNGARLWSDGTQFAFTAPLNAPAFDAGAISVNGLPVATQLQLEELFAIPKVDSFNGRTGRVLLETDDILRAGGVSQFNPVFAGMVIVPTPWDFRNDTAQAANCAWVQGVISALLCSGSVVTSFNGRGGDVVLTADDITAAGTAPLARPEVNTAPYGDASKRIANTLFVSEAIYNLNMNLQALIQEAAEQQLAGYAPLNSPQFTGAPTAPTAAPGTATGQLATTAFVEAAIVAATTGVSSFNTRTGAVVLDNADITAAGGALLASPALTGTPTAPTATAGDNTTKIATTAFVHAAVAAVSAGVTSFNTRTGAITLTTADITGAGGAPLASPTFTGTPSGPTASPGTSTTQLATTAYVQAAVAAATAGVASFNGRTGAVNLQANDISAAGGALLASPALSGVPTAPTAAAGTSSTQIATTAFVTAALTSAGVASFNGRTGAVSLVSADVSAAGGALLASPAFSGTPTAPTASPGTNNTQLATTGFVMAALGGSIVSTFNGRSGTVTLAAADITGAGGAILASPAFTGTPTAPTPTAGDSSTKLATTAFVAAAIAGSVGSFNGRSGAVTLQASDISAAGGALLAGPALTGTPTAPTATTGTATNQIATCQFVLNELGTLGGVTSFNGRAGTVTLAAADVTGVGGALLASPAFTGTPTVPTASPGTNTTQAASTAFVAAAVASGAPVSGARVLLNSTVISSAVASVDVFGNWTASYDVLEFYFYDMQASAEGALYARLSMDGSTFDASASDYYSMYNNSTISGTGGPNGAATPGFQLGLMTTSANPSFPSFGSAKLRLGAVGGSNPSLLMQSNSWTSAAAAQSWSGGGLYNPASRTTNVQGLRFIAASGNLTRGTIKVYGIVK